MVAVYSGFKQFVGLARETTPGTGVAMTATLPVTKAEFEDKPHMLMDKSWNGSMSSTYGVQQGTVPSDLSISGNVYPDTIVHLLANILGDRTSTTGATATTLSAAAAVGATSLTVAASVATGQIITVGTGAAAETVTVTTGGTTTLTVFPALLSAHASGETVTPLNQHAVSLLNSGQGQPITHTFTHYMGPGTNGARQYPGSALSDLAFKFSAMNALFEYDAKGSGWPSLASPSAVTAAPSGLAAMPAWRAMVGIGGPAATNAVATIMDGSIDIKRKLDPEYTLQGSQNPYSITRGELDVSGKLTVLAVDDSAYQHMRANDQPSLQVVIGTGAGLLRFDMGQAAFETAKPNTSKTAIEYDVTFAGVINSTNAGASGGLSPIKVTVANAALATVY